MQYVATILFLALCTTRELSRGFYKPFLGFLRIKGNILHRLTEISAVIPVVFCNSLFKKNFSMKNRLVSHLRKLAKISNCSYHLQIEGGISGVLGEHPPNTPLSKNSGFAHHFKHFLPTSCTTRELSRRFYKPF